MKKTHFSAWTGFVSLLALALYTLIYLVFLQEAEETAVNNDYVSTYIIVTLSLLSVVFSIWGYVKSKTAIAKLSFWIVIATLILGVLTIVLLSLALANTTYE